MNNLSVIIVAGGIGARMESEIPKQFLEVMGVPMLMITLRAFIGARQRILVLPNGWLGCWKELCLKYNFELLHEVVAGGSERFFSVKNGLALVDECVEFVAVHDGVRPFVTPVVIENAIAKASEFGCAVPVVDVVDSVRMVGENGDNLALVRSRLKSVQTPQVFKKEILMKGYQQEFQSNFTDDASVVENIGYKIGLSEGDPKNIKITFKEDLK